MLIRLNAPSSATQVSSSYNPDQPIMPAQDLIDVRINVDGKPLQEYMEPEATGEGNKRVRYVEVKAGQEFSVQITWKAGFELMWTEALTVEVCIDDINFKIWKALEKKDIQHRRGRLLHDEYMFMQSVHLKNDITGTWERCPYTFGVLGISECRISTNRKPGTDHGAADEAPVNVTPQNVRKLGSIKVEVYRAAKVKLDKPYLWNGERPEILDEISEKALKGQPLKNNVK